MPAMTTTPLWVPLVVAVLGLLGTVIGTIAGVVITQRRSDRREREAREAEREREHERWRREDELRTFDQRRAAYTAFYAAVQERRRLLMSKKADSHGGRVADKRHEDAVFDRLGDVEIYGTGRTRDSAAALVLALMHWAHADERSVNWANPGEPEVDAEGAGTVGPSNPSTFFTYREAEKDFLAKMRTDLGLPER